MPFFAIPAFASMFFDSLISSYSFSIKRTGYYCRTRLEPLLREGMELPPDFECWEQFLLRKSVRQNLAYLGNLGLTLLACGVASIGLLLAPDAIIVFWFRVSIFVLMVVLFLWTAWQFHRPDDIATKGE